MAVYSPRAPVSLVGFDLDCPVSHVCLFLDSNIIKLEDDDRKLIWSDPEPDAPSIRKNVSLAQDTSVMHDSWETPGGDTV